MGPAEEGGAVKARKFSTLLKDMPKARKRRIGAKVAELLAELREVKRLVRDAR